MDKLNEENNSIKYFVQPIFNRIINNKVIKQKLNHLSYK